MGSMGCFRGNCESVCCNRYSDEYGYICDRCLDELIATGPTTDIEVFMQTNPKYEGDHKEAIARYEAAFPKVKW